VGDPISHGGAILSGSGNVFINGQPAAFAGSSTASCVTHASQNVAQGASTVFINTLSAAFVGVQISCGGAIMAGSPNVFIGDQPAAQSAAALPVAGPFGFLVAPEGASGLTAFAPRLCLECLIHAVTTGAATVSRA
jgi:uncharacterized Zn-binding protein involved in type VI secretion